MASGLHHLLLLLLLCSISSGAQLRVFQLSATDLPGDTVGPCDGYVKVYLGSQELGQTGVAKNNKNPWWGEEFHHNNAQPNDRLRLDVYDEDMIFDDLLGTCQTQVQMVTQHFECSLKKGTFRYSYTLG